MGVCVLIILWNFLVVILVWKIVLVIIVGNTFVFKLLELIFRIVVDVV